MKILEKLKSLFTKRKNDAIMVISKNGPAIQVLRAGNKVKVMVNGDLELDVRGNLKIASNKSIYVESGWRHSSDGNEPIYKIDLNNPTSYVDLMEERDIVYSFCYKTNDDYKLKHDEIREKSCQELSDSGTHAQAMDASHQESMTKDRQR